MKSFIKTITVCGALIVLFTSTAMAQKKELVGDLKKSNDMYSASASLSMDVKYEVFRNYSTKVPNEIHKGFYKRKGESFYTKMLGVEIINNKELSLAINREEKLLLLGKAQKMKNFMSTVPIDTLIGYCQEVKKLSPTGTSRVYEMNINKLDVDIEKLWIFFDSGTSLMSKIVLFYREPKSLDEDANEEYDANVVKEKPRLEISYQNVKLNAVIPDSEFSEKGIISKQKDQYKGIGVYSNYKVINQKGLN